MNDTELQIIIGKKAGWTKCACNDPECGCWFDPNGEPQLGLPDYLHSHDAVQKVIEGLDEKQLMDYMDELQKVTECYGFSVIAALKAFVKATPHQKCLALARMWGEGKE